MCENLVKDYSSYMKLNFKKELDTLENTADEMLTRFDEFENLLSMVRSDSVLSLDETLPNILAMKPQLDELFNRIDRLEEFVSRVEEDVDRVEAAVAQGEADLTKSSNSKLKSFLQPIFFKTPPETSSTKLKRNKPLHDSSSIFNADDYFGENIDNPKDCSL